MPENVQPICWGDCSRSLYGRLKSLGGSEMTLDGKWVGVQDCLLEIVFVCFTKEEAQAYIDERYNDPTYTGGELRIIDLI